MGHYRSEMMTEQDRQKDARFYEVLDARGKLYDVPLSSFTFGELSFLLDLFELKYGGAGIQPHQLERLREIIQKVGAA